MAYLEKRVKATETGRGVPVEEGSERWRLSCGHFVDSRIVDSVRNNLSGHLREIQAREDFKRHAREYVERYQALNGEPKEFPTRDFVIGFGALAVGGLITLATYEAAEPGATYIIWFGPMIYGGLRILLGIVHLFD